MAERLIYDDDNTVRCYRPGNDDFVDVDEVCDGCPYFGGHIMNSNRIICRFGETEN